MTGSDDFRDLTGGPKILTNGTVALKTCTAWRPEPHAPRKLHSVMNTVYTRPPRKLYGGIVILGTVRTLARIAASAAEALSLRVDVMRTSADSQFLPAEPEELEKSRTKDWHCPIAAGEDISTTGRTGALGACTRTVPAGLIDCAGPQTTFDGQPYLRLATLEDPAAREIRLLTDSLFAPNSEMRMVCTSTQMQVASATPVNKNKEVHRNASAKPALLVAIVNVTTTADPSLVNIADWKLGTTVIVVVASMTENVFPLGKSTAYSYEDFPVSVTSTV
jgi:hypothetical protein